MSDGSDACAKHIPAFDEAAAEELLCGWEPTSDVDWVMGNPMSAEVRRRWPRFEGRCECGFHGICYASRMHYAMGDW